MSVSVNAPARMKYEHVYSSNKTVRQTERQSQWRRREIIGKGTSKARRAAAWGPKGHLSPLNSFNSVLYYCFTYSIRSPSLGGFLNVELKNRINAFFKRLRRFGYINCVMTIDDLIDHSDYELFTKVCPTSHSFTICFRPIVQVTCVCVVILFSCLIIILICIKK